MPDGSSSDSDTDESSDSPTESTRLINKRASKKRTSKKRASKKRTRNQGEHRTKKLPKLFGFMNGTLLAFVGIFAYKTWFAYAALGTATFQAAPVLMAIILTMLLAVLIYYSFFRPFFRTLGRINLSIFDNGTQHKTNARMSYGFSFLIGATVVTLFAFIPYIAPVGDALVAAILSALPTTFTTGGIVVFSIGAVVAILAVLAIALIFTKVLSSQVHKVNTNSQGQNSGEPLIVPLTDPSQTQTNDNVVTLVISPEGTLSISEDVDGFTQVGRSKGFEQKFNQLDSIIQQGNVRLSDLKTQINNGDYAPLEFKFMEGKPQSAIGQKEPTPVKYEDVDQESFFANKSAAPSYPDGDNPEQPAPTPMVI